ncbi:MAG TPA: hypothetical protein VGB30_06660 [bacterium]|jgi:hypothetical protein
MIFNTDHSASFMTLTGSPAAFGTIFSFHEDIHWSMGQQDAFIIKMHPSGNYLGGVPFGGTGSDYCNSVDIGNGFVYACGTYVGSVDFDPGAGNNTYVSNGDSDCWLSRFDEDLNYWWSRSWGGTGPDNTYHLPATPAEDIYITGYFNDTVDFDPNFGIDEYTSAGSWDAYLLKIVSVGNYGWTRTVGGPNTERGMAAGVGPGDYVFFTGSYSSTADFAPPTSPPDEHTSAGQ